MIEALWSMEFQTSAKGEGTGIVVMKDGKIAGGDNQYFYVGTYKLKDRTVTADVSVTHYAGAPVRKLKGPGSNIPIGNYRN